MNNLMHKKPLLMGALMGPVMLTMLHPMLTGGSEQGALALVFFVGAHFAIVLCLVLLGLFACRYSSQLQQWLNRVHRPSWAHFANMIIGAGTTALLVHLYLHGGL